MCEKYNAFKELLEVVYISEWYFINENIILILCGGRKKIKIQQME